LEYGSRRRLFTLPGLTFSLATLYLGSAPNASANLRLLQSQLTDPRTAQYDRRFRHNCAW